MALLHLLVAIFFVVPLVVECEDQTSLQSLTDQIKAQMPGLPWDASAVPCVSEMRGVICDPELATITGLDFSGLGLTGTISPAIGRLETLQKLDLSGNKLSGPLPLTFANLTALTHLDVSGNERLNGTVPGFLGGLNLVALYLHGTNFTGQFPTNPMERISSTLEILSLGWPDMPTPELYLGSLKELTITDSGTGNINTPSWNNLTALQTVVLNGLDFTGSFPLSLWNAPSLKSISITNCKLGGFLPTSPPAGLLTTIKIANTPFTGPFPASWLSIPTLKTLSLANVTVDSIATANYPDNLTSSIDTLALNNMQLSGDIPLQLLHKFPLLRSLSLANNNLSGPLDDWLSGFPHLESLSLAGNKFVGNLPEADCPFMKQIDISCNQINGSIPHSWYTWRQLQSLNLRDNKLRGNLPIFTRWPNLHYLDLGQNQFSGILPILRNMTFDYFAIDANFLEDACLPDLERFAGPCHLEGNSFTCCAGRPKPTQMFKVCGITSCIEKNYSCGDHPPPTEEFECHNGDWKSWDVVVKAGERIEFGSTTYVYGNLSLESGSELVFEGAWASLGVWQHFNIAPNVSLRLWFNTTNLKYMRSDAWTTAVYHSYINCYTGQMVGSFEQISTHTGFCTRVWQRDTAVSPTELRMSFLIDDAPCAVALRNVSLPRCATAIEPELAPDPGSSIGGPLDEIGLEVIISIVTIIGGSLLILAVTLGMLLQIPRSRLALSRLCSRR